MEASNETQEPTRVLVFAGDVTSESVASFMREFTETDAVDGPIEVRIYSSGGDAYGGTALYDLVRCSRNEITTIGYGQVASASFLLFQAGDLRVAAPNCTFLVHPVTDELSGNAQRMMLEVRETQRLQDQYCQIVASRSKISVEKVAALYAKETYFTAKDAVEFGLADALLETA